MIIYRTNICRTCLSKATTRYLSSSATTPSTTTTTSTNPPPTPTPTPNNDRRQLHDLTPSDISYYWDTTTPDASQLAYADKFFTPTKHSPVRLWSAAKFLTIPLTSLEPEVAFLGRSNVGKSSLLNAIMGKVVCWTSSKPGRTRVMNAFGIGGSGDGSSRVCLLDMPGYGKASRAEWGREIMKYLEGRKQLRRVFVLIDGLHGLKQTDHDMLALLREYHISHQIILTKVDRVLMQKKKKKQEKSGISMAKISALQGTLQSLRPIVQPDGRVAGPGALGEILTCSVEGLAGAGGKPPLGISAIRWAILAAAGYDEAYRARLARSLGQGA